MPRRADEQLRAYGLAGTLRDPVRRHQAALWLVVSQLRALNDEQAALAAIDAPTYGDGLTICDEFSVTPAEVRSALREHTSPPDWWSAMIMRRYLRRTK